VGFYHFFHANVDPAAQARYFLKAIAGVTYNARLVADIELNYGVVAAALEFLEALGAATGVSPMVYTDLGFIQPNFTAALGAYPLWLADYTSVAPTVGRVWSSYVGWQSSQSGEVAGISWPDDLDSFTDAVLLADIQAGNSTMYGKLINGSAWGPVAAVCKALGITYTWDPAKQIVCINGASDAAVGASGLQVVVGSQAIAGELFGSIAWCPIAAVLNTLGVKYTWNQAMLTLTC
jgi:hypothetical protein